MNAPAKTANNASGNNAATRKKRQPKPMSPQRKAAEDAYANAKSDQEKTVARDNVKIIRFTDIVVPRVKRALNVLNNVERMANRNAYTWTPEQAAKIIKSLQQKVDAIAIKLSGAKAAAEEFTL
jgi:hypothetical protein